MLPNATRSQVGLFNVKGRCHLPSRRDAGFHTLAYWQST